MGVLIVLYHNNSNPDHGKLGHSKDKLDEKVSSKNYNTSTTFNKGDAPKKVELGKSVKQAACASQHTVCLTEEGEVFENDLCQVFVWGLNKKGTLGMTSKDLEISKPVKLNISEKIIKIDVGSDFTVALSESGKLYGWGSNYFGQLGSPSPLYCETPQEI